MRLLNRVAKLEQAQSNKDTVKPTVDYTEKLKALREKRSIKLVAEAEKMLTQGIGNLQSALTNLKHITTQIEDDPAPANISRLKQAEALLTIALDRTSQDWRPLYEQELEKHRADRENRIK